MNLQVFVEVFWEGKILLTIRARVNISVCCFAMGHYVPFQMIHTTEYFAAIAAGEAPGFGLDLLV